MIDEDFSEANIMPTCQSVVIIIHSIG